MGAQTVIEMKLIATYVQAPNQQCEPIDSTRFTKNQTRKVGLPLMFDRSEISLLFPVTILDLYQVSPTYLSFTTTHLALICSGFGCYLILSTQDGIRQEMRQDQLEV